MRGRVPRNRPPRSAWLCQEVTYPMISGTHVAGVILWNSLAAYEPWMISRMLGALRF